ncbi:aminotransferase [Thioalkalivibrio sp. HK1]|uniref:aminotransferase n=1 Tax=Thioalkalivibrio sp. HK1 TaxID=1469245 RepID=UPI00047122A2|nr:aminotransferase [Thioalkalivibrio sp. HK1]
MKVLRNHDPDGLHRADLDHCIHPWTDFADWKENGSTIMVRGEGAFVEDAQGNRYIDGMGGLWFANLGYGRKELIDAAAAQLTALPQYSYFTNIGNPPATELAARLAALAPGDLNHVFYSTGGSAANESAVRIAHYYFDTIGQSSRRLLISRRNAYHGSTFLTAALSGKMDEKAGFHFPKGLVHHISEANCYRMPEGIRSESEYCDFLAQEFEEKITELGEENIACFFAEPIMGAGGVLMAPTGYHRRMKGICERHGILYVSDEVVTAFARLGRFFASRDLFDVQPDMIVAAKGITSGYIPLGVTLVSDRIYEGISRPRADGGIFSHGFTYSGHAVACAVALANIEVMEREDLCAKVQQTGDYFLERLKTLSDLPIVGDVRGSHFMLCVELVEDRSTKKLFPDEIDVGKMVDLHAQERGLIVRPIRNLCVLSPALILDMKDIDRIVSILRESIEATVSDLSQMTGHDLRA